MGVGADRSAGAARLRRLLEEFHRWLRARGLVRGGLAGLTGGLIPPGGLVSPACRGSVLLAGDAAGLAHPVTGAGVAAALASGVLAGEAAAAFRERGEAALAEYQEKLHRLFGAHLARGARRRDERESLLGSGTRPFAEVARRTWVSFREFWEEGEEEWRSLAGTVPGASLRGGTPGFSGLAAGR